MKQLCLHITGSTAVEHPGWAVLVLKGIGLSRQCSMEKCQPDGGGRPFTVKVSLEEDKGSQVLSSTTEGQAHDAWKGSCWESPCAASLHVWGEAGCGFGACRLLCRSFWKSDVYGFFVSVQKEERSVTSACWHLRSLTDFQNG